MASINLSNINHSSLLQSFHLKDLNEDFLGMSGFELGTAGCKEQMLPLCYAAPQLLFDHQIIFGHFAFVKKIEF